jgi:hypothetical protein
LLVWSAGIVVASVGRRPGWRQEDVLLAEAQFWPAAARPLEAADRGQEIIQVVRE